MRRRRLAYSGPLPPGLAAGFTVGQLAVLRIIADEMRAKGECSLSIGAIAARAGVCVTTVRTAIRIATGDGLITVTKRPRHGAPNLTNVVKVVSGEWLAWIARAGKGGGGSNLSKATDTHSNSERPRPSRNGMSPAKIAGGSRQDRPLRARDTAPG
jgi:hypothetical protein